MRGFRHSFHKGRRSFRKGHGHHGHRGHHGHGRGRSLQFSAGFKGGRHSKRIRGYRPSRGGIRL